MSDIEKNRPEEEQEEKILDADKGSAEEAATEKEDGGTDREKAGEPSAEAGDGDQKDSSSDETADTENVSQETENSRQPEETPGPEQEELEFITHESVRDKSKMAEGTEIEDELISRKKTKRRSVDADAARVEKVQKIAKKNLHFIIIGAVVIIVAVCLLVFGVRRVMERRDAENSEQPLSSQEYERDENEQVNELVTAYYGCYADGDTDSILEYAYPMSDSEKSYIQMYAGYVEEYQDIVCYTKTGAEDGSYIVSASFNVKYQDVDTVAPGLDFFYVRTDENGSLYIDNVYSPFNLLHQEYSLDQAIVQLIQEYESGEDVISLQAGIQTSYEQALEKDPALRTMVEETLANAINTWNTEHEAAMQQQEEAAQQQIQQEQQAQEQQQQAQEQQQQIQEQQPQTDTVTETENRAWVYVNDTVNIRQEPNESSAVLASATRGSQVRQIATTSNGWVRVRTGDVEGYIKAEYISTEAASSTSSGGSISDGQTIRLTSSVNIRSAMSESSSRVGLAYAGESVTVVQSYGEGWCRVNWNGQTGYVRTDVLASQ